MATSASKNIMFDFLHKCTLLCGGPTASIPGPGQENKAELSKEHGKNAATKAILDPMDAKNYLTVHLTRPIGILFEENHDDQYGGAFVADINKRSNAAADGSISCGDQLVAIGTKRVSGMDFEAMKLVFDSVETKTKLSFFRGPAESLYGPSGASVEWLDEFLAEREKDSEREASPDLEHVVASEAVECEAEDAIDDEGDEVGKIELENEADALATFVGNVNNEEDVESDVISEAETPNSYCTKGIMSESCYSPKGVDEIEILVDSLETDPVSIVESNDDDSAASSVWSESDDYIGELEELPMKPVSALAALGAASTLTANLMLA